ncbi:MAG: bacterial regulatory helix-turn-helix, lysR family protein [Herbaspirillum sp.]|nr:bacterial regulatory helix-turn-helix, lysR family protein [Herbaspirillum sp.]
MDYLSALKTFVRVAELGSLTRAALDLNIKTSTASRHIAELEADLRIALFNRSTRGVSLTEAGRTFYPHTLKVIAALGEAREAASSLNLSPSGLLRVTLPSAFGRKHIMPHMPEFIKRYPDIDLDMIFSDDIMNLIETRIDLGIRIGTLEDSSLMARKLGPHRRVACASPDYIEKCGLPATPDALALHQCILFSRRGGNAWYATRHGAGHDDPLKISVSGRFTSNDGEAMLEAALGGLGIALLPSWLAYTHLAAGSLVNVLPDWHVGFSPDEPSIWGVYPRKKTVSSKVRTFLDYLVLKIGEPPYWE